MDIYEKFKCIELCVENGEYNTDRLVDALTKLRAILDKLGSTRCRLFIAAVLEKIEERDSTLDYMFNAFSCLVEFFCEYIMYLEFEIRQLGRERIRGPVNGSDQDKEHLFLGYGVVLKLGSLFELVWVQERIYCVPSINASHDHITSHCLIEFLPASIIS